MKYVKVNLRNPDVKSFYLKGESYVNCQYEAEVICSLKGLKIKSFSFATEEEYNKFVGENK